MRLIIPMTLFSAVLLSCGPSEKSASDAMTETAETTSEPTLELIWETPDVFITNESVHYEPSNGQLYVANIEGEPAGKDGVGSISILSKTGEIIDQEWVTGLNAPKGMAVMDGKLYVTDVDALVEIDLASGDILNTYEVEGAQFLNDADTDGQRVYFSDMRANKILYLENGDIHTFAENQPNINGLRVGADKTLYGLDAEGLKKYNTDGSFSMINSVVTGGDGLIVIDSDTFLASRWKGEIYLIQDGKETLLLDTSGDESNTADIGFIPEDNIVVVPTFFKNKVAAYQLTY
ncbi:MAG TPA: hypothetical protein VK957_03515 [Lunatimonas sp.]|nr:hypothetical protein [Lunatimonas sp.]